jgi:hypothetical protein
LELSDIGKAVRGGAGRGDLRGDRPASEKRYFNRGRPPPWVGTYI